MGTNINECVHYHMQGQITGQSYLQVLKDAKSRMDDIFGSTPK